MTDGEQTLYARKISAALDGTDLRDAQPGHCGQVLERPVMLHPKQLDFVSQAFTQPVLRRAPKAEFLDCIAERLP